jgi:hypothetical protein
MSQLELNANVPQTFAPSQGFIDDAQPGTTRYMGYHPQQGIQHGVNDIGTWHFIVPFTPGFLHPRDEIVTHDVIAANRVLTLCNEIGLGSPKQLRPAEDTLQRRQCTPLKLGKVLIKVTQGSLVKHSERKRQLYARISHTRGFA